MEPKNLTDPGEWPAAKQLGLLLDGVELHISWAGKQR